MEKKRKELADKEGGDGDKKEAAADADDDKKQAKP